MLIGYARVSTLDQNPQHQIDALNETGCKKIFTEKISGASKQRRQLEEAVVHKSKFRRIYLFLEDSTRLSELLACQDVPCGLESAHQFVLLCFGFRSFLI